MGAALAAAPRAPSRRAGRGQEAGRETQPEPSKSQRWSRPPRRAGLQLLTASGGEPCPCRRRRAALPGPGGSHRHGSAPPGTARIGSERSREPRAGRGARARLGTARPSTVRFGSARFGTARIAPIGLGSAQLARAGCDPAGLGSAWPGCHGSERQAAWPGEPGWQRGERGELGGCVWMACVCECACIGGGVRVYGVCMRVYGVCVHVYGVCVYGVCTRVYGVCAPVWMCVCSCVMGVRVSGCVSTNVCAGGTCTCVTCVYVAVGAPVCVHTRVNVSMCHPAPSSVGQTGPSPAR